MKPKSSRKKPAPLAASAGPALRRAAKAARRIARMHGGTVCYLKDGKIISEKP